MDARFDPRGRILKGIPFRSIGAVMAQDARFDPRGRILKDWKRVYLWEWQGQDARFDPRGRILKVIHISRLVQPCLSRCKVRSEG